MEDDLLADVRSFSFENPLTEEEQELLYLRARSAGLTFCGCAHASFLCKLVHSLRCLIKSRRANRDSSVPGEDSDLCVGIIGMGHMGRQLLTSLLEKSGIKPSQIKISSRTPDSAVEFIQKGVECLFDNRRLAAWADVLFLCSLPSHLPKVCADLHSHLSKSCLVYSFTSAVPVNRILKEKWPLAVDLNTHSFISASSTLLTEEPFPWISLADAQTKETPLLCFLSSSTSM
ncbi:NADP-dependent oxidoreductase domain-containing protein 1 isoform X2 [Pseudochaenichthys georgianus]|uniref:NADP-dependent oxidoreductase domain-containing protein 1 isoform X2 n=1 Tax=Pseudochaenichthys georgianus TaxID=52239 RepID=UPI00146A1F21|nr:NADP-dependent oxidoreductase domain-containing protein 1 isoform X2 [Pseudochaenichthys georgianus]